MKISDDHYARVAAAVEAEIEAAVEFARNSPEPKLENWELEIDA